MINHVPDSVVIVILIVFGLVIATFIDIENNRRYLRRVSSSKY